MAIAKEKRLILADVNTNHNKWYNLELHDDGRVISHWRRIGDSGKEKVIGYGEALFEAKCREKLRKGYTEQKTLGRSGVVTSTVLQKSSLQQVAAQQIQTSSPEALDLINRLVRANTHAILSSTTLSYNSANGTFSTPLGMITQDGINEARRLLNAISRDVVGDNYHSSNLLRATNSYLSLVPQDFGRRRKTLRDLYPDIKSVQAQSDLLDRLEASLQTAITSGHPADTPPAVFEASVHVVESRVEFQALHAKFKSTLNRNHASAGLKLHRAYSVEIAAMRNAFEAKGRQINNTMQLWHGTNTANILSILKDGFRLKPPATAAITGKMFGDGLYFALQSSKSLNYSHGYWNGSRHNSAFMFLCDVAVGRYQVPVGATSKRPQNGYDSYWAKPQISGVTNDEIVVFDAGQINPRYLLEFRER